MRHNHTTQIDGLTFHVNEFGATDGLRLLTTLTKLAAGPVAKGLKSLPESITSILDAKIDLGAMGAAVSELADRLDEDAVIELVKRLLAYTTVGDGPKRVEVVPQFDTLFQGRYATLFKLIGFVLSTNFKTPLADWLVAASVESGEPTAKP